MPRGEVEPRYGDDDRQERVRQAIEQLEQGIDSILTGDAFAAYLATLARFHSYSYGNVLLIWAQRPDATRVAGYRTWKGLGRQVRKGEKGIKILVPYTYRVNGDDDLEAELPAEDQVIVRGFGVGNVFDISQTDGQPLPEPPKVELIDGASDVGMRLYVDLVDSLDLQGIPVNREHLSRANGSFDPRTRRITIGDHIDGDQATKTLTHEAAHAVAGHTLGMNSQDVETVAESAAFVVLSHYGIDTSGYTFPYVASWARDREVFKRNLAAIQQTSHTIITSIEGHDREERRPRRAVRERTLWTRAMDDNDTTQQEQDDQAPPASVFDCETFAAGFTETELTTEQLEAVEEELHRRGIKGAFRRRGDA